MNGRNIYFIDFGGYSEKFNIILDYLGADVNK